MQVYCVFLRKESMMKIRIFLFFCVIKIDFVSFEAY